MAESILPGTIHRQTEFVSGLTGACGPNALAMGTGWSVQRPPDTYQVYAWMRGRNLCDVSGASTLDALKQTAQQLGFIIPEYRGYGEPWPDWQAFYLRHVGQSYILMETANGQALRDSISGQGENATNLHYHFIGVVGYHDGGYSARVQRDLPSGWWACDGDNFASGDVLQFYPDSVMAAAQPCGAFALAAKVSIHVAWTKQADGTGRDSGNHVCGAGDMNYLTAHALAAADGLMSETYLSGTESFLPLSNGHIVTAQKNTDGSWTIAENGAQALVAVWTSWQTLLKQPPPPPVLPPPHPNPVADKALAFVQELKELLPQV